MNKNLRKFSLAILLVFVASFVMVPAALAFDGRGDDTILVAANEVIEDDLYLAGNSITVDGTVRGDLVAAGNIVTINGTVEGDLWFAGQTLVLNGQVTETVRGASSTLVVGSQVTIGGDLLYAGASLELSQGSSIAGDLLVTGGQANLAGDVAGDVRADAGGLNLTGTIGGNLVAVVGSASEDGVNPMMYMPGTMSMVSFEPGLNIDPEASIGGDVSITSPTPNEVEIPSVAVSGSIERLLQEVDEAAGEITPQQRNPVLEWTLDTLRSFIALALVGVLLALIVPAWITRPADTVQSKPLASLGWGVLSMIVIPFAMFTVIVVAVLLVIFLGALTLGNLSGAVALISSASLLSVGAVISLAASYLTKLAIAYLGGRWILNRLNPALAEKPVWSMLLGVTILTLVLSIPILGGLLTLIVTAFGLGALFLLLRERFSQPQTPAMIEAPAA